MLSISLTGIEVLRYNFGFTMCNLLCKLTFWSSLFSLKTRYFICSSFYSFPSHFPISTYPHSLFVTQMLQRSLNQRKPPQEMQWRRTPSPRMTKTNLKKKQNRMKNKTKILKGCSLPPSERAANFYLFVIFCVAMMFSCWGSFQREVFWLKRITWWSNDDLAVNYKKKKYLLPWRW